MCSKWHPRRWRHTCIRRTNCHWLAHIPPMGFPWSVLWLLPSVHQLFEDCSHTHYPWDTPTDKNMGGFKSGECAAHSISHFLLISLSLNRSLSQARESFVVWGVAPILPEPLFISIYTSASSQWCPKLHQYCHIAHSWVPFFLGHPVLSDLFTKELFGKNL